MKFAFNPYAVYLTSQVLFYDGIDILKDAIDNYDLIIKTAVFARTNSVPMFDAKRI